MGELPKTDATAASDLTAILRSLAAGERFNLEALLPWLCLPDPRDRARVNEQIARALLVSGRLDLALVYAERSWRIAGPVPSRPFLLPDLLAQKGRVRDALDAVREVAFDAADRGDLDVLAEAVVKGQQYARAVGRPPQDHVLSRLAMRTFAASVPPVESQKLSGRKLRIGYVFFAEVDSKSTLPPIFPNYARYHDKSRVEVAFYSLQNREVVLRSNPGFVAIEQQVAALGCTLTYSQGSSTYQRTRATADMIRHDGIDVLVLNYGLYAPFILACMRPSPVIAVIDYGDPQMYTSIVYDLNLTNFSHFEMESLCPTAPIPYNFPRSLPPREEAMARQDLGLPTEGPVVMCSGSIDKFSHALFWQMLSMALNMDSTATYLFLGITTADLSPETRQKIDLNRCVFLGYRSDFSRILPVADIVLDTFPTGGGFAVVEAMALGIPIVMQRHDLSRLFDKKANYFPYSLVPGLEEITVPASRLDETLTRLLTLIQSPQERYRVGDIGQSVFATFSSSPDMVRALESQLINAYQALTGN